MPHCSNCAAFDGLGRSGTLRCAPTGESSMALVKVHVDVLWAPRVAPFFMRFA